LRGVRGTHSEGPCISRPQLRAEISLTRIRKDGEHALFMSDFRSHLTAGVKNRSRRDSAKNPLLLRKTARTAFCVVVPNRDETVHDVSIEDFRNKPGTDALDPVRAWFSAGEDRRFGGFYCKETQRLDFLLHYFAGACSCSPGTDTDNE